MSKHLLQKRSALFPNFNKVVHFSFCIPRKNKIDLPPASRTNIMFVKSVTMENDGHEEEQI